MIKIFASIEHVIGENLYKFACPSNLNLEEAKQALFFFGKVIGQLEDQAKAQQQEQAPQEQVASESQQEIPNVEGQ